MVAIYVDADACPVRDEVHRVADRLGLPVHFVANGSRPLRPSGRSDEHIVIVPDGPDVADDWIAEHIAAHDLCITGDIPLASRCLAKGALALSHDGHRWTDDNIGSALAGRAIAQHLREMGQMGGGRGTFSKADRSRFLSALDTLAQAALRAAR